MSFSDNLENNLKNLESHDERDAAGGAKSQERRPEQDIQSTFRPDEPAEAAPPAEPSPPAQPGPPAQPSRPGQS